MAIALFLNFCSFSAAAQQSCLPEGITFNNQTQIDSFPSLFSGCSEILGAVTIAGENIFNLDSLAQINTIRQDLQIAGTTQLHSLSGFNNLIYVGRTGDQIYGLNISGNTGLTSLDGLNSLSEINGSVQISANSALTDFNGLENLEVAGGFLLVFNNISLSDITGLRKLREIRGNLIIDNNPQLLSLKGIDNISHNSISDLKIRFSANLSFCSVTSICNYLAAGGIADIRTNASGCESREAVEQQCQTSLLALESCLQLVFPNPTKGIVYLAEKTAPFGAIVELFTIEGYKIYSSFIGPGGSINLDYYTPGLYFVCVSVGQTKHYRLLVLE